MSFLRLALYRELPAFTVCYRDSGAILGRSVESKGLKSLALEREPARESRVMPPSPAYLGSATAASPLTDDPRPRRRNPHPRDYGRG